MLKRIFTLSSLVLLSYTAIATDNVPTAESMQSTLSKAIPEITVDRVKATPVSGFYEVTSGPSIFYVSQDGQYIFYGELLELKGDQIANLTELTRQEFAKAALAKIDPNTFIVFPAKDKAKAVVTIATDVDCGYCRKLHEEVPALNAAGITVRYIAFPRTPEGTPSYEKSAAIWCAKDPKQTIDDVFAGKPAPTVPTDCKHPLVEHYAFIQSIGANATPVIILENGMVLPGYMPAAELIKIVDAQPK